MVPALASWQGSDRHLFRLLPLQLAGPAPAGHIWHGSTLVLTEGTARSGEDNERTGACPVLVRDIAGARHLRVALPQSGSRPQRDQGGGLRTVGAT